MRPFFPARFSAARPVAATPASAGAAYAEMLAGAQRSVSVRSITLSNASNAPSSVALVRASAIGTGAATGIATGIAHRIGGGSPPSTAARLQVAWSSAPTGSTSKLREAVLPVGTGQVLELWNEHDGPLVLEPSASLLLINSGSGIAGPSGVPLFNVNVTWEEGPSSDH